MLFSTVGSRIPENLYRVAARRVRALGLQLPATPCSSTLLLAIRVQEAQAYCRPASAARAPLPLRRWDLAAAASRGPLHLPPPLSCPTTPGTALDVMRQAFSSKSSAYVQTDRLEYEAGDTVRAVVCINVAETVNCTSIKCEVMVKGIAGC